MHKLRRRNFLGKMSMGLAATVSMPAHSFSRMVYGKDISKVHFWPPENSEIDERYWEIVKNQFTTSDGFIMANTANLCPSPYFISDKANFLTSELSGNVSYQYRSIFDEQRRKSLDLLTKYLGANPNEIGITRNTSESNNIIVNGLDLGPGDEVIIWDQNHPTNNIAWKHRARRSGFSVKALSLPDSPKSKEEILDVFTSAITGNTRMVAFSHISNVSGIALPTKEICALARQKGILTLVDGAQAFGFLNLNLKELGCDFYSGSSHKWLMGPLENGILYVAEGSLEQLWPNIVGAGWSSGMKTVDEKLCTLGQRNNPSTAAMADIIDFHETIGKQNIELRVRHLCNHLKEQIKESIPKANFVTPFNEELSGGVVIFEIYGNEPRSVFENMYNKHHIAIAPTGGIRISPNINCTLNDIDRIIEALINVTS